MNDLYKLFSPIDLPPGSVSEFPWDNNQHPPAYTLNKKNITLFTSITRSIEPERHADMDTIIVPTEMTEEEVKKNVYKLIVTAAIDINCIIYDGCASTPGLITNRLMLMMNISARRHQRTYSARLNLEGITHFLVNDLRSLTKEAIEYCEKRNKSIVVTDMHTIQCYFGQLGGKYPAERNNLIIGINNHHDDNMVISMLNNKYGAAILDGSRFMIGVY